MAPRPRAAVRARAGPERGPCATPWRCRCLGRGLLSAPKIQGLRQHPGLCHSPVSTRKLSSSRPSPPGHSTRTPLRHSPLLLVLWWSRELFGSSDPKECVYWPGAQCPAKAGPSKGGRVLARAPWRSRAWLASSEGAQPPGGGHRGPPSCLQGLHGLNLGVQRQKQAPGAPRDPAGQGTGRGS